MVMKVNEQTEKQIIDLLKKEGFKVVSRGGCNGEHGIHFLNKSLEGFSIVFSDWIDTETLADTFGIDIKDVPADEDEAEEYLKKEWEKIK